MPWGSWSEPEWHPQYKQWYRRIYNSDNGKYEYQYLGTASPQSGQSSSQDPVQSQVVDTGASDQELEQEEEDGSTATIGDDSLVEQLSYMSLAQTAHYPAHSGSQRSALATPSTSPKPNVGYPSTYAIGQASYSYYPHTPPGSSPTYHYQHPAMHHGYSAQLPTQPIAAPAGPDESSRRIIKSDDRMKDTEDLDERYKRVRPQKQKKFFCQGRVFRILWTEPAAGASNHDVRAGGTRGSTHFSVVSYGQQVYSEIRRFVVVRPREHYSSCIPIQTYNEQGTLKPGLRRVNDHALIYSATDDDVEPPALLPGEQLMKNALRMIPANDEELSSRSRINFGKTYTVEHNLRVLNIGKIAPEHLASLENYWRLATYDD